MATVRRGFAGKLYRNTGNYGTPTLNAVDAVGDVTVTVTMEEADASTREGAGLRQYEPTMLGIEISGQLREDETDADYLALEAAYYQRSELDLWVLSGPSTESGVRGFRGDFKIFDWTLSQQLAGVQMRDFKIKPCVGANVFKRAIVVNSALSYVNIDAANP